MGFWFDEKDDNKTLLQHTLDGTPDSIRQEAERELIERGFSKDYIFDYQCKHDN